MDDFRWFMPVEMHFGAGEFAKVGEYAACLGRRAFVTMDKTLAELGLGETLLRILKESDVETVVYDNVKSNPDCRSADEAATSLNEEGCDFVIGLGGGSPMDFAKAVAVAATHDGPIWDYVNYSGSTFIPPTARTLPILEIATTAGTGSKVTPGAVIVNPDSHIKAAISSPYTYAKVAVVDPELMVSMPPNLTASTGVDALAHALESYINVVRRTPFSDLTALAAIKLVGQALPAAVKDGTDIQARAKMAWASTLAGITISQANTTVVHAMSQPVSGRFDVPHGKAVAALLSTVIKHTWRSDVDRFALIAEAMGVLPSVEPIESRAEQGVKRIESLLRDVGMDVRLAELGVTNSDLAQLTDDTLGYMSRPLDQHPVKFGAEDILKMFEEAWHASADKVDGSKIDS